MQASIPPASEALTSLRLSVDRLGQGLQLLLEAQQAQTELLRTLLESAGGPETTVDPVEGALSQVAEVLEKQSVLLDSLASHLGRLPDEIGREVAVALQAMVTEA